MSGDDSVAALEAEREQLITSIRNRQDRLARVQAGIRALRDLRAEARPVIGRHAIDFARAYAASLGPDEKITVAATDEWALSHGWNTPAIQRKGMISRVLRDMVDAGEIVKVGHGHYRTLAEPRRGAPR